MSKSLVRSFSIGRHFENFIANLIKEGRYSTASEVVRDSLRLLELQHMRNQSQQVSQQPAPDERTTRDDRVARERTATYLLSEIGQRNTFDSDLVGTGTSDAPTAFLGRMKTR